MDEEKDDMNIKIQNSSPGVQGQNTGSCRALANYINHEDAQRIEEGKEPIPYVSSTDVPVTIEEVISKIDRNHSHLSAKDDKFYQLIVSPSKDEVAAMGDNEQEIYAHARVFMKAILDEYAGNFGNDNIKDCSDLVAFWKPHFFRGNNGDLQFHIHCIISRKSKGNKYKISPLTNHRGTTNGPVTGGFDRKHFFKKCERVFDVLFQYERKVAETFEYNNAQSHGTSEDKVEQTSALVKEQDAGLKEKIEAGINRRRETLQKQNDVSEVVDILSGQDDESLATTLELANLKGTVMDLFAKADSRSALDLKFALKGMVVEPYCDEDGVCDFRFSKNGRTILASELLGNDSLRKLLNDWHRLTGQMLSYKVREERRIAQERAAINELKTTVRRSGGFKLKIH